MLELLLVFCLVIAKKHVQEKKRQVRSVDFTRKLTTFYWLLTLSSTNYILLVRNRNDQFSKYFTKDGQHWLVYCNDVSGLVKALGMEYKTVEWRLCLDSSVRSMKAVLLHIGNKVAVVPMLLFLITQPLPRDGAWRKTMEPQKPSNFPGS